MQSLALNPWFYLMLAGVLAFCASVLFALFSWANSTFKKSAKAAKFVVCALVSLALIIGGFNFLNGIFYFDRSAVENDNGFVWRGKQYVPQSGVYDINKGVAKTNNGHLLSTVERAKGKSFIALQNTYGTYLYVREDVSVPESGRLTGVYIQGTYKSSTALLSTVEKVIQGFNADYRIKSNDLWKRTGSQDMRKLSPCFENCPVGTRTDDYIGTLGGKWVYAKRVPHQETEDIAVFEYDVYQIPDNICADLEKLL